MPRSVFISYRRSDTISETGRIYDRLVTEFGREHVFKDVDDIPLGVDFAEHLDKVVSQCQVLLVIMGKTWATVTEADGSRRLDNPDDFVRIEVESALKRGIPVIPVLVEGVSIPKRSQLPASLHPLVRRNGTQVGYDPRFHTDMNRLIKGLKGLIQVTDAENRSFAEVMAKVARVIAKAIDKTASLSVEPTFPTSSYSTGTLNALDQVVKKERKQVTYRSESLDHNVSLDMLLVPGGRFLMGSLRGEGYDNEIPQHEVTVQPLLMGKYPVTQAQWRVVAGLPKVAKYLEVAPSEFLGENRPVEQVSWYDAVEFCQRLSRKTGKDYRLPSEAEWECACRAGTTTAFHTGKTITSDLANYDATYDATEIHGSGSKGKYRKQTTDVGSFLPNVLGLYDMHGNAWEWCQDDWHDSYKGAPIDGGAWESFNSNKVVRGGAWNLLPKNCRSAIRFHNAGEDRYGNLGFRVSCSLNRT